MISINRDTIATFARTDLLSIPFADFTETLAAHDNADHFAELALIELRDDADSYIAIFAANDASDSDIDAICLAFDNCHRNEYTFLHAAILDAIQLRIDRNF